MKKRNIKISLDKLIFLCIITTIIVAVISLSRYRTSIAGHSNAKVAIPVINLATEEETILDVSIVPGEEKEYIFSVENNKEEQKSEVTMEYTLQIKGLSNLPFEFELYTYENGVKGEKNLLATSGNTTGKYEIDFNQNIKHTYKLLIKWRDEEISYKYSKVADYVQIVLNSNQVD